VADLPSKLLVSEKTHKEMAAEVLAVYEQLVRCWGKLINPHRALFSVSFPDPADALLFTRRRLHLGVAR